MNRSRLELNFNGYRRAVGALVGQVGFRPLITERFRGEVEIRDFGSVEMARIRSSSVTITRSQELIRSDRKSGFFIPLVLAGQGHIQQAGRGCALGSNQFTLVNMRYPHNASFSEPSTRLLACFSADEFLKRQVRVENFAGIAVQCDSGAGRLAKRFLLDLFASYPTLNPEVRRQAINAAVDLIVMALRETPKCQRDNSTAGSSQLEPHVRLSQALVILVQHLPDEGLSPSFIAEKCGISVRYLHRLFEQTGQTVAQRIKSERLKQCFRDLNDPSQVNSSILDIALRWGFNDAAHFSRSFSAQFGTTPRSVRQATSIRKSPRF